MSTETCDFLCILLRKSSITSVVSWSEIHHAMHWLTCLAIIIIIIHTGMNILTMAKLVWNKASNQLESIRICAMSIASMQNIFLEFSLHNSIWNSVCMANRNDSFESVGYSAATSPWGLYSKTGSNDSIRNSCTNILTEVASFSWRLICYIPLDVANVKICQVMFPRNSLIKVLAFCAVTYSFPDVKVNTHSNYS